MEDIERELIDMMLKMIDIEARILSGDALWRWVLVGDEEALVQRDRQESVRKPV